MSLIQCVLSAFSSCAKRKKLNFVDQFNCKLRIGRTRNRCSISVEAREFWFLQAFRSNPEPTVSLIQCVLWAFSSCAKKKS